MKVIQSSVDTSATVETLLAAIEKENMKVVAHINGQANAAKMGKQVPADQILEVFRPDFAIRVWNACKPAGHDIPLRIHIYEEGDKVIVACRMPGEVFGPYAVDALNEIGAELDVIFSSILASVSEA